MNDKEDKHYLDTKKWVWKMEYCKSINVSPSELWAWSKAESAYNIQNELKDHADNE